MCDYSLQSVKTRPAVVGDKLVIKGFGTGTRGFASTTDGDYDTAVCLLPGTELAFEKPVTAGGYDANITSSQTARFRQINKEHLMMHHDCLEFGDGKTCLLTYLDEGQRATVLQLPAAPKTKEEAKEQERLAVVA